MSWVRFNVKQKNVHGSQTPRIRIGFKLPTPALPGSGSWVTATPYLSLMAPQLIYSVSMRLEPHVHRNYNRLLLCCQIYFAMKTKNTRRSDVKHAVRAFAHAAGVKQSNAVRIIAVGYVGMPKKRECCPADFCRR